MLKKTVANLPEIREPLHQLGSVVFIELDIREIHFEHGRAGIPHPEEHQLRFPEVHWC